MRRPLLVAVISTIALSGCATKYQAQSFTGGFSETRLDTNVFRVTFNGNGFTGSQRAEDLVLLRSAELAIKNNFSFFVIAEAKSGSNYSSYTTPVQSQTNLSATTFGNTTTGTATTTYSGGQTIVTVRPSSTNTVIYFKERPNIQGLVYNAEFICNSLGQKYEVRCGAN
jgi:hypothetical protein